MLKERVRRWIWQKTQQNKTKTKGEDVERGTEEVDTAKNTTKKKGKNNNKTNKNTTRC